MPEQIGRARRHLIGRPEHWRWAKRELARWRRRTEREALRVGDPDALSTRRRAGLRGWID